MPEKTDPLDTKRNQTQKRIFFNRLIVEVKISLRLLLSPKMCFFRVLKEPTIPPISLLHQYLLSHYFIFAKSAEYVSARWQVFQIYQRFVNPFLVPNQLTVHVMNL